MHNLGFTVEVQAGVADELTVGGVWGPGVVEEFRFAPSSSNIVLHAWISPGRLPTREGIAVADHPAMDNLVGVVTDPQRVDARGGLWAENSVPHAVGIGRLVPWAAWWIIARVENLGGVAIGLSGLFVVRLLEGVDQVLPVARGTWEELKDPRAHVWGVNPGLGRSLEERVGGGYSLPGIPGGRVVGPTLLGARRS